MLRRKSEKGVHAVVEGTRWDSGPFGLYGDGNLLLQIGYQAEVSILGFVYFYFFQISFFVCDPWGVR